MDLQEKENVSGDIIPVVIIGNGPSGICLSYFLSGYTPYLSPDSVHPNVLLQGKLRENPHLSLLEQDLEYLCEGLEGRSSNPVAVLFDSLLLPDSDFGSDHSSPLDWRYEPSRAVNHLVLGRGPPGGAWHAMEGSMLTLSLANWMELPGLKLKDWMREKRRNVRNDRATPLEIASYYQHYVSQMDLEQSFACGTTVTAVTREQQEVVTAATATSGAKQEVKRTPPCWRVTGTQRTEGEQLQDGSSVCSEVPFSLLAEHVVLATGTHDIPARLGVEGEELPFVCHSFWELENAISRGELDQSCEPILVVGAGLTAADAVLAARHLNAPVFHAFRRPVTDPGLIFNQLPKMLYPEYHKVHQMMTQQQYVPEENAQNIHTNTHTHTRNHNLHSDSNSNSDSDSNSNSNLNNNNTPSSNLLPPPLSLPLSLSSSSPSSPSSSSSSSSSSYPGYLSFPKYRVVEFRADRKCVLESDSGQRAVVVVSKALVLIGAHPNLSFLKQNGRPLSQNPGEVVTCRRNPVEVDPFTNSVLSAEGPGMYAMGPLVGENFVRFLKGGALAIASDLCKKENKKKKFENDGQMMDRLKNKETEEKTSQQACVAVDS